MWTFLAALIAAVLSAYVTGMVAEDYRRYRDAQGIAAALAGELSGYLVAVDLLQKAFAIMRQQIQAGVKLPFKEFEAPKDVVYLALVEKIGLLGPDLARETAYVYQRILGFRTGYALLTREHASLNSDNIIASLTMLSEHLTEVAARGKAHVAKLHEKVREPYTWPRLPAWRPPQKESEEF
jgi:hypothetical protein